MSDQRSQVILDRLFDQWVETYPDAQRRGFHRDGIIDESTYQIEEHRLLFVLLEPNSRDGAYDRYYGWDLRKVLREELLRKDMVVNLARWTRIVLDGVVADERPSAEEARDQLCRVAVINLKKLSGSGTADYDAIEHYAWRDREFLRRQIELIRPQTIVACGRPANALLAKILGEHQDLQPRANKAWRVGDYRVLPGNHPSLRPMFQREALRRLVELDRGDVAKPLKTGAVKISQRKDSRSKSRGGARATREKSVPQDGGWVLRPYPHFKYRLPEFLSRGVIGIGWASVGDYRETGREELLERLRQGFPGREARWYSVSLGTLLRFRDDLREGDLVVVAPNKEHSELVAVAQIAGPYGFARDCAEAGEGYPHQRPVKWLVERLHRGRLPATVARSLRQGTLHRTDGGAFREFCAEMGWV